MSKDKLTDYDATASNNTDVGGISIAEGMLPSAVNNAIREQMSHQKEAFGAGTPLYVDQTNNRLGVNTVSPSTPLHVVGANGILVDTEGNGDGSIYFGGISGTDRTYLARSSDDFLIYNVSNGPMRFATNNTERMRILSSGGITFNGDTAAANALDDYEEGDYDVTVAPATSGTISLNGSYNRASYTKVGRLVTVNGFVIVDGVSSPTGYFTISIPFVVASLPDRAGDSAASLVIQNVVSSNISDFVGTVNEGATSIAVQLGDGTTTQNDSAQQIAINTYIMFNVTYSTT